MGIKTKAQIEREKIVVLVIYFTELGNDLCHMVQLLEFDESKTLATSEEGSETKSNKKVE